jgi:hypothetical protein
MELVGILDENPLPGIKKIFDHPIYSLKEARNLNLDAILITDVIDREKKNKKLLGMNSLGPVRIESL